MQYSLFPRSWSAEPTVIDPAVLSDLFVYFYILSLMKLWKSLPPRIRLLKGNRLVSSFKLNWVSLVYCLGTVACLLVILLVKWWLQTKRLQIRVWFVITNGFVEVDLSVQYSYLMPARLVNPGNWPTTDTTNSTYRYRPSCLLSKHMWRSLCRDYSYSGL